MKSFSTGGIDAWPSDSYLNVWVCPLQGTLQGFATPPGGDPLFDGIVVAPQYFGSKAYDLFGNFYLGNNFDLGRTATHEVGHWLNLRHIWGDGDCAVDDFVNDTPPSDGPNFGCTLNTESCSSTDMVQNFMDYTYDGCMSLFTTGQKNRAHALFAPGGAREDILLSVGCGYQNAYCQDIINEVYVDNYASTVYQIAAGDVDGDLVDDIFVVANTVLSAPFIGSYDNTILYRHEKIDGNYSSKIEIATISTFLRLGISKMFLVDMETDGDLDIVLIAPEGSIMWVENLGENQFSAVKQVLTSNKSSNHRFSDIDGDGHLDLVASFVKRINPVYPSSLDTSIISYYKNDGLGNFSEHTRLFQKLNADAKKIELADINQDGYIDIITSEEQSKDLSYYVNLGNETFNYEIQFKSKNSLDDFILDNEKIAFDIDADGDEDILSISINRQIHLLKNNGTGDFTTNVISNSNKVNYFKPDFINNDQFPDICYVQDNDEVFYLINNGDGNFTEQKVVTLSSESNPYPSLALGFFDDDNIKDVVLSKNYFGNISYFSSSITESFTSTAVKSVDPIGVGPENETPNNTILQYTIQFQNNSAQTVQNIQIIDTIHVALDIFNLEIVSASHSYNYNIDETARILTINFPDINLTSADIDSTNSFGSVSFSVFPIANLDAPIAVTNTAFVNMNDCENIATNTTLNTLIPDLNTAVFNQTAQDTYFTLAPNPMSTFTNIDFKINESIIEGNLLLYSIQGQLLKTYPIDGWQTITIEKADLNAGMYLLQYTNNNNVLQGGVQKLIIQ